MESQEWDTNCEAPSIARACRRSRSDLLFSRSVASKLYFFNNCLRKTGVNHVHDDFKSPQRSSLCESRRLPGGCRSAGQNKNPYGGQLDVPADSRSSDEDDQSVVGWVWIQSPVVRAGLHRSAGEELVSDKTHARRFQITCVGKANHA